jgi:hypothetical protein
MAAVWTVIQIQPIHSFLQYNRMNTTVVFDNLNIGGE